jgi:hypothetical protein
MRQVLERRHEENTEVENNRYVVFKRNIHGENDVNGFSSISYISFMKEEEIWEREI